MENVINIFVDFYLVIAYQSFFSVSETLFSGTKIDRFLLLWPGYNFVFNNISTDFSSTFECHKLCLLFKHHDAF